MKLYNLTVFGKGLDTTRNPTQLDPGFARLSQNFIHNRGDIRAESRSSIDRDTFLRTAAAPIYGLYEFINNSGVSKFLCVTNGVCQSFTHGLATAKTTVKSGMASGQIVPFTTALNFILFCDGATNRISDGTSSNTFTLQIAAPAVAWTATPSAGAGLTAGLYHYDYARYSSTTGELSPSSSVATTATTTGGNLQVTLQAAALTTTLQFDKIQLYRTKVNTSAPYYQLSTPITVASLVAGYVDSIADTALTVLSTIHTNAGGASKTDQPVAAIDVTFHRGRVHLISLTGTRSRHRWSQLNSYVFDSTTSARHDVEPDDGDYLWRAISFDGVLVLLKDRSIHIMSGDVNENSFTWSVASQRNAGIGAYCPWTVACTPVGIIFMGENGVYLYRPGMPEPLRISDPIQTTLESLDYSRRLLFVGGYAPKERAYLLAVTPQGATTNTVVYAYFIDTGAWSQWIYDAGSVAPSIFATMHNGSSRLKYYFGDSNGYIYEGDTSTGADGTTSGTNTGTATASSATSITDSTASFRTSGDGLLGLSATVQVGTAIESEQITSNSGTSLTTNTWTTTPATSNTYYVGAIDLILHLNRTDCETSNVKRFYSISIEFQAQAHNIPLLVGYTIDNDTAPTYVETITQNGTFRCTVQINRIGVGISPYIRCCGTGNTIAILRIDMKYDELVSSMPRVS